MKILFLDIETAPNTAYVWGLFDQNISHEHMTETSYILCWSAKWFGQPEIQYSECRDRKDEHKYFAMMRNLHALMMQADVIVHYYGSKFDIPTVNKEFVKLKIPPPSPYKQIDMKLVVSRAFRFESNKLDYIAEQLGFGKKIKTDFQLWVDCMNGKPEAWKHMKEYNQHDVRLLEKVYLRLIPWIEKHPNWGATKTGLCCPKCGGTQIQRRGTQVAVLYSYVRYHCQGCGAWFRGNKTVSERGVEKGVNIAS